MVRALLQKTEYSGGEPMGGPEQKRKRLNY